jgi:hypothetical protein
LLCRSRLAEDVVVLMLVLGLLGIALLTHVLSIPEPAGPSPRAPGGMGRAVTGIYLGVGRGGVLPASLEARCSLRRGASFGTGALRGERQVEANARNY